MTTPPAPLKGDPAARRPKYRKLIQDRRGLTILDQLIVSGSNFVTAILLVRGLGLERFGVFTVIYALILLANNVQLSLICSPMLTLASLCPENGARMRLLRGMFGVQIRFCLVAVSVALLMAALFWHRFLPGEALSLLPAALLSLFFYLLQDWLRRYYFAAGKAASSVWNDAISYLGQAALLFVLWYFDRLSVATALWAIAATSAAAFLLGFVLERLRFTSAERKSAWRQARVLARDLAIASQLQWFVYQGAMLIGAGLIGAGAAGSVRATQNVIGPVNVAYQALDNLVPLKAGEEMRREGALGLARFLIRFGSIGLIGLCLLFLSIGLFSRDLLTVLYGKTVGAYAGIFDLQMIYFLLLWPLRQLSYLFRTLGRTRPILIASLVAALASLLCIYPAVRCSGAIGIMWAAVVGQTANLTYLIATWMRTRRSLLHQRESVVIRAAQ